MRYGLYSTSPFASGGVANRRNSTTITAHRALPETKWNVLYRPFNCGFQDNLCGIHQVQLSQAEITQQNPGLYSIAGTVDFSTVPGLMRQASGFIKKSNQLERIEINLSQVISCNSAALALLLEISKQAHANNIKIHLKNIPGTILTIAKAYGIENEIREIS
jgi:anti-anti-sigma factor